MKNHTLILMVVFFFSIKLQSQTDYRKGYILQLNSDTTHGFIEYKGINASSKKCMFKKAIDSEPQEFRPDEIKAYRFTDSKYYVSKVFDLNGIQDFKFLEYLIDGIVDIYYYRDELHDHYFADKGDGKLYELKNEEKEIIVNNEKYIRDSKEYIGVLKLIFNESQKVGRKVDNISLNHKSLINIANEYHNEVCLDRQCIIFEKKLPRIKVAWGPVIGLNVLNISSLNKIPIGYYYFMQSDFKLAYYPSVGLFVKLNLPYLNERLNLQYELTISKFEANTTNTYIEPTLLINKINYIEFAQSSFNNCLFLKYEFPNGDFRPSIQLGTFVNYFYKTDYMRKTEVFSSDGNPLTEEETTVNPLSNYSYGLCMGIGIIKKINTRALFMDLRYQRGNGLFEYFNTNFFSLNLGFQLSK